MNFIDGPINNLIRLIRDYVNKPLEHYWLRQNKATFSQLSSSMDMICDADDAIRAYEFGEYPGSSYRVDPVDCFIGHHPNYTLMDKMSFSGASLTGRAADEVETLELY